MTDVFIHRPDVRVRRQSALVDRLKRRAEEMRVKGKTDAVKFLAARITELESDDPYAARLENKAEAYRQAGNTPLAEEFSHKAALLRIQKRKRSPLPENQMQGTRYPVDRMRGRS